MHQREREWLILIEDRQAEVLSGHVYEYEIAAPTKASAKERARIEHFEKTKHDNHDNIVLTLDSPLPTNIAPPKPTTRIPNI